MTSIAQQYTQNCTLLLYDNNNNNTKYSHNVLYILGDFDPTLIGRNAHKQAHNIAMLHNNNITKLNQYITAKLTTQAVCYTLTFLL